MTARRACVPIVLCLFLGGCAETAAVQMAAPATHTRSTRDELLALLTTLASRPGNHWLLRKHLDSVAAVVRSKTSVAPTDEERLSAMLEAFRGDAARFETYLEGKRLLIIAWVSPRDGVTSYFRLALPAGWNESDGSYPLFVNLHGTGGGANNDPYRMLAEYFQSAKGIGDPGVPSTAWTRRRGGFVLEPWGRGDVGYKKDPGNADIWEGIAAFEALLKADKGKYFLHGFSLGGMGTLHLAAQRPEVWRAIAPFASRDVITPEQAERLKGLPTFLVIGALDRGRVEGTRATRERLAAASGGREPQVYLEIPDVGHSYVGAYQEMMYAWMMGLAATGPLSTNQR